MTKFYQQDIVQRISHPHSYGIVLHCWHDADDIPPSPLDPLMRPLKRGEVGVSFLADSGESEIVPESSLRLIDRTLGAGDYCKRNVDDVCSGVVINLRVRGRVEHAITGEKVDNWWTMDDLEHKNDADIGDHVVFDDWVGQIIEVFDEAIVEVADGQLMRVPELGSRLNVGERGSDVLPPPTDGIPNILDYLFGGNHRPHRPHTSDTVIAVEHSMFAIAWLALNQSLSQAVAEEKRRPPRFWAGKDISKLTLVRGRSDLEMRVGDRVQFKNPCGKPYSTHGQEEDTSPMVVQTFVVTQTETILDVLWQDGSCEALKSTSIIPYLNPDEYDCWPGDHVVWKNEDEKRAAIVQSVNAADRTAVIFLTDTRAPETVSVLELDAHGTYDQNGLAAQSMTDGFGVQRADFVFIHPEGTTNGFEPPYVPRIGELEGWIHESPLSFDCSLTGWRKAMSDLGTDLAAQRNYRSQEDEAMIIPTHGDGKLKWFGEVTGLNLNGTVEVMHPDLTVNTYPLERLTRLYDGLEQLEDEVSVDGSEDEHDEVWTMDEDGKMQPVDPDDPDWEDDEGEGYGCGDAHDGMDVDGWTDEGQDGIPPSLVPMIPPLETRSSSMDATISAENQGLSQTTVDAAVDTTKLMTTDDRENWKRFDVLSSVPVDHAFYSSTPATPSKAFMSRLNREYRVLASSLPDSILVRAYEDRTDLLRSLIIGPENTPYEDAPFVIDWMLESNFPFNPPIAHFHSWTNGNGRVNPNLYEEGKVCLSILGTWAGDRNETWNAARSSLLQAFVSIQGLVLVKEPWFCEPAYEKLRGTEEGSVNSRLYSEKAYVLSRGFVRRALEVPLGSLESEIVRIYYTHRRLKKVLDDARKLIEKSKATSEEGETNSEFAVPRLTIGGIITLERTLTKLQGLWNIYQSNIANQGLDL